MTYPLAYLVADIGSNSIVWTLVNSVDGQTIPEGCGRYEAKLKQGLNEHGELSKPYIGVLINTIQSVQRRAEEAASKLGFELSIHCFATQFLRQAANKDEVINQFEAALNLPLRVLSADEEACFELKGVRRAPILKERSSSSFMHIDLGGGSTEISIVDSQFKTMFCESVRLGKIDYWKRYQNHEADLFGPCKSVIANALLACKPEFIIVGGGAMTTYARYVLGCANESYNANHIESHEISAFIEVPQHDEKAIIGQQFVKLLKSLVQIPIFVTTLGVRVGYIQYLLNEA